MKLEQLKLLIKETIRETEEFKRTKYVDENGRKLGAILAGIFNDKSQNMSYKSLNNDPSFYVFVVYVSTVKQDASKSMDVLSYLVAFSKTYKADIEIKSSAYGRMAVHVKVPRTVEV